MKPVMNAIDGKCDVVNGQTDRFIRIRSDLDRPVVTAKQHQILLDQSLGHSHTNARTGTRVELIVDAPELAPAGVDKDRIPRLVQQKFLS
jgi:hypothetical protein